MPRYNIFCANMPSSRKQRRSGGEKRRGDSEFLERQELTICSMLGQLDLGVTPHKPNLIGNTDDMEQIAVVNLNSGKNKKVGQGVYNMETRPNLPKMPRMSKKREIFTVPKSTTAMTLSYQLAQNIEERKLEEDCGKSDRSRTDRQSILSFRRDQPLLVTPNSKTNDNRKTPSVATLMMPRQTNLITLI